MRQFNKAQFAGMSICVAPFDLSQGLSGIQSYYLAKPDDVSDLEARIALLKRTIRTIVASDKVQPDPDTLKVVLIPEFFLRGALGAYYAADAADYPMEKKLITDFHEAMFELNREGCVIDDSYLFVLGTILLSRDSIDKNAQTAAGLYYTGDYLMDIFTRLYPGLLGRDSLRDILRAVEEGHTQVSLSGDSLSSPLQDAAFVDVLNKTIAQCTAQAEIEVANRTVVIPGAVSRGDMTDADLYQRSYIIQKLNKSRIDFILNSQNNSQVSDAEKYTISITKYPYLDVSGGENKQSNDDGRAIVQYHNVTIGVDICLDHSSRRLVDHLATHPGAYVDLQVVPSAGMVIHPSAVIAKQGGYVFNCDGEYPTLPQGEGVDDGRFCHTILKRVDTPYSQQTGSAVLDDAMPVAENINCLLNPEERDMFPLPAYNIHIYPVVDLPQ